MKRPFNALRNTAIGKILDQHPIWAIDVGARGGFEPDLAPIAFAVNAIAVEPEPEAFARLSQDDSRHWRKLHPVNTCVGDGRPATLRITRDPISSTTLDPDSEIATRFDKPDFAIVDSTRQFETRTLDDISKTEAISDPDYLKIDVEGAEQLIFDAAPKTLQQLSFIKTEVSFLRFRKKQPLAAEIDIFMRENGFALLDYRDLHRWRIHGHVIHPRRERRAIPYARGQIATGDALYARTPDTVAGQGPSSDEKRLKAAALLAAYGYFDHAEEMLLVPSTRIWLKENADLEPTPAIDEASRCLYAATGKNLLVQQGRTFLSLLRNRFR